MRPNKEGQIVKFHTPLEGEDPDQLYVLLELHDEAEIPRAKVQALNTGLPFPPISIVSPADIEVAEVSTQDLIGHVVTIRKSDLSQVLGRIVSVNEKKVYLDLSKGSQSVGTNVHLTVLDNQGVEHVGTLLVN